MARVVRVHRDGERVVLWHPCGPERADAMIASQSVAVGRTVELWSSLPALLRARAEGGARTLALWMPVEALGALLHQGVLDERDDALYGSVQGHRLATRWAQVLVRWSAAAEGAPEAWRIALRQSALQRLQRAVLAVEDWSETAATGSCAARARVPAQVVVELPDATLRRVTGGR